MTGVIECGIETMHFRTSKKSTVMKNLKSITTMVAGALIVSFSLQTFAQEVLGPIVITASNYKYLNAVSPEEAAQPVKMLEHYAAAYDVKGAEFYEEEYDTYLVSFYIPEGKILAAYDKEGKLIRTAERFKNTALPRHINQAVTKRFPNWAVTKDVYVVNYYSESAPQARSIKKVYKLVLENNDKRMRVKLNDAGEFL
jgi:hypothetical protein